MTTAQHLDTIDLLRSREFPAEPGPSDVGSEGPGFHIAELNGQFGYAADDEGGDVAADQRAEEHGALLNVLERRWGEPDLFSLASTQLRVERDEEVPDPWRRLSDQMEWLRLWRIDNRWIAVGLSRFQLLAVVTEIDPL
ncbi:hypothetical protein OHA61_33925 [Streptomyces sp. NBC_00885]|uniref:hypothetical protein n=1 Tax=Streptomyces sp. NBC_00885 TaxID=2975857 RepID=UPI0038673FF9|nr:hypothetical protein OHA61_33925 [Streptomyces sp. NBC_00885]